MNRKPLWDVELASRLVEEVKDADGPLLPILHSLQETFGYIDRAAIAPLAEALNLSRAEIHGVVSFYHDFRSAPAEGRVLKLCRAESCQATGCEKLVDHLRDAHGVILDQPNGGGLQVETVYCLGNCALSPSALLDGAPIGRLDAAKLDEIALQAREAAP